MVDKLIKGEFNMLITRQNLNGGPKLKTCPLVYDESTGSLMHKVGYCNGCNEPLGIRTVDLKEVMEVFGLSFGQNYKLSLRERVIKFLGGKID